MHARIEDYAMIGDCQTAALVGPDASIDWLCLPRFDSAACFAALLGTRDNGRWKIAPADGQAIRRTRRRYRGDTFVLETEFECESGTVAIIDCMPPRGEAPDVLRIVEGRRGTVPIHMELIIRFDYGHIVPWVRHHDEVMLAIAGPDMLRLDSPVATRGEGLTTVADFTVSEGQRVPFVLTWYPSHRPEPRRIDANDELHEAEKMWSDWIDRCPYDGPWRDSVRRSLLVLKALTYTPTGGIAAAATTSLPEQIGGVRNWDYRFCWIRDASFTLRALMNGGYSDEARAWREWLLRAAAGQASELQIMYGLSGERRLEELQLPWLAGYEGSPPVRIGNAAWSQHQLDVYGELMNAMYHARRNGIEPEIAEWHIEQSILRFLESDWHRPDHGIWETRAEPQQFTHSKVMAWVAFDRAVKCVENYGLDGPVDRWRALRDQVHAEVCAHGFNRKLNTFTRLYDSDELDASALTMSTVGFLPGTDPRIRGTVDAIQRDLMVDGFVRRYHTEVSDDGLPPGEGAFLLCTCWLADALERTGRHKEACEVFERVLAIQNDVGLLAECYDPINQRMLGNFPQALSHIGIVNTALKLAPTPERSPAEGE